MSFLSKVYASQWIADEHHYSDKCYPYLFDAKLLPLGQSIRCVALACEGKWILASTFNADETEMFDNET